MPLPLLVTKGNLEMSFLPIAVDCYVSAPGPSLVDSKPFKIHLLLLIFTVGLGFQQRDNEVCDNIWLHQVN